MAGMASLNTKYVMSRLAEIIRDNGLSFFSFGKKYLSQEYSGRSMRRRLILAIKKKNVDADWITNYLLGKIKLDPDRDQFKRFLHQLAACMLDNFQGHLDSNQKLACAASLKTIDFNTLDDLCWSSLAYLATSFGLYDLGLNLRENLIQKLRSYSIPTVQQKDLLIRILNEANESQNDERAAQAIQALKHYLSDFELVRIRIHTLLIQGKHREAIELEANCYSVYDKQFADLIRGKRIAVVGPAPNDHLDGKEIDTFDFVVRTNYRGRDKAPGAEEFGAKTNLSYFNRTYSNQIFSGDSSFLCDLDFSMFKNEKPLKKFRDNNPNFPVRKMISHDYRLNGNMQMIPNILYDLLHFEPKEIKVFKSNFFMSNRTYYSSYVSPSNAALELSTTWENHAAHDLVTQLRFTRNLFRNNLIQLDEQAESIVKLSDREYMTNIENIYSIH